MPIAANRSDLDIAAFGFRAKHLLAARLFVANKARDLDELTAFDRFEVQPPGLTSVYCSQAAEGELGANPMTLVRVSGISRRQTEPRILTADEIRALISRLATNPYRVMVVMALSTGLKCSELFALKWMDFDWSTLTVLVRRAIVDGVVGDVKAKYSCSGLPLDPALAEILFTWKRISEFSGEGDWIFASPQKAGEFPLTSLNGADPLH